MKGLGDLGVYVDYPIMYKGALVKTSLLQVEADSFHMNSTRLVRDFLYDYFGGRIVSK